MTTIQQLLREKAAHVWSIHPDETVLKALEIMAEKDIGALIVMDATELVGIVTERDYARKVVLNRKSSSKTPVREIMTRQVVCAAPELTIEDCMAIMTEKRVRYLPVLSDRAVAGMISIGDLVSSIISDQRFIIDQLAGYIHGEVGTRH